MNDSLAAPNGFGRGPISPAAVPNQPGGTVANAREGRAIGVEAGLRAGNFDATTLPMSDGYREAGDQSFSR